MKRILSLLLSISMLCTLFIPFPTVVSAATSGTCGDNLTWSFSNGTLTISGTGAMYDYSFPEDEIDGDNNEDAYILPPWYSIDGINIIKIKDGVTSIGDCAFAYGYSRSSRIDISDSVTSIGKGAFCGCELASITIPASVTNIETNAFDDCGNLEYIIIDSSNQSYCSLNGILFDKSKSTLIRYPEGRTDASYTIPESVTTIGDGAFNSCSITSISIPESVLSIGAYAFEDCWDITSINISSNVTHIGAGAFMDCSGLTDINIPSSVTSIADYTFYGCAALTSITIPNGVTSIGKSAFTCCDGLTEVILPDNLKTIGEAAFRYCYDLSNIDIPANVTNIGSLAFEGCGALCNIAVDDANQNYCSIDGVLFDKNTTYLHTYPMGKTDAAYTIPKGIIGIGNGAFSYSNLSSIDIPDSIASIGVSAFYQCEYLTEITVPQGVTAIESGAFYRCISLTSVNLPEGIIKIGKDAFYYCKALKSITIPSSVKNIGEAAFYNCCSLKTIVVPDGITIINNSVFSSCDALTSVSIPDSVKSIGRSAFSSCYSLTNISLPDAITFIGEYAFAWCTKLNSITLPNGLKTIEESVFRSCSSLADIAIPNGVTTIRSWAFEECDSLADIHIPASVTGVASNSFEYCTALTAITVDENNKNFTSLDGVLYSKMKSFLITYPSGKQDASFTIPDTVVYIAPYAFAYNNNLKDIAIPVTVGHIGDRAFYACRALTSVNIPEKITSIEPYTFAFCDSLESVVMPQNVTSIGEDSFYSCDKLKDITLPAALKSIGYSAFSGCNALTDVYYGGDKTSWNKIEIGDWNTNLTNAQLHYITQTDDLPIIVLPGIMGSTLKDANGILGVPVLTANSDFIPQNKLVIADTTAAATGADGLIETLEGIGDHIVYPCPYDWRLSLQDISEKYLKPLIETAKKSTGKDKVILVGHSMGGLVARTYIQSDEYEFDVDSLYMIGTPNQGSTAMIPLAEHGIPYDGAQATVMAYNYNKMTGEDFNKATMKEVRSFINNKVVSTAQLLPSYGSYYYDVETYTRKGKGLNDYLKELNEDALSCGRYQTMAGMNKNKVRTILFASEEELDTPQALKAVYNGIYPVLEYTPPFMKNKASYMANVATNSSPYVESTVSAGDGTVLTYSATVSSKFKNIWTIDQGDYGKHMKMFGGLAKTIATYLDIMPQMMSLSSAETETTEESTSSSLQIDISGADAIIHINGEATELENGCFYSDDVQNGEYVIECVRTADNNRMTVQLLYTNNGETKQELISFLNDTNSISFKITDGILEFENKTVSHLRSINNNGYANLIWDANENAKSYKIYAKNFSDTTYSLLDETEETEYLTNDTWLNDFSDDCICYYVIPVFEDEADGGYSEGARNYNTAQAAFDYIVNEEEKNVSFTDLSTGDISSWEWDFDGDGMIDSTEQNPTYTYTNDGVYDVTLTVSGASGTSAITCNDAIKIGVYPKELIVESETANIRIGESTSLTAYILMSDESQREAENITFISGDDSIISVDGNIITAKTIGTTSITASANGLVKNIELSSISDEVTITLLADGYGFAEGGGNYQIGETILVSATPIDNEEFLGWYKGDELISADKDYWFDVTEAVELKAKFTKNNTSYVNAKVNYCGYDSNELYAYITYNYIFDDCTAYVAIYDKDGRLQELTSQLVEKNSVYSEFCIPSTTDLTGYDFKIFFWQNVASIKPVSNVLMGTVE